MGVKWFALFLVCAGTSGIRAQSSSSLRVILLGGQSNADGLAPDSGLPLSPVDLQAPQTNVPYYFYVAGAAANPDRTLGQLTTLRPGGSATLNCFGPEVSLGFNLASYIQQQPGATLAIIKFAWGGTTLYTDWKAGGDATTKGDGDAYYVFQKVVSAGLADLRSAFPGATVQIDGMVWVQGESDIGLGSVAVNAYGTNLSNFIADLRVTFSPTLPFFFSRISDQQTYYSSPTNPYYQNYLTLRDQQELAAGTVSNVFMIDADGPNYGVNSDNIHFNADGQLDLGAAFATSITNALSQAPVAPSLCAYWLTNSISLTWALQPQTFILTSATNLAGPFAPEYPVSSTNFALQTITATLPISGPQKFFRLQAQ